MRRIFAIIAALLRGGAIIGCEDSIGRSKLGEETECKKY
jgi:hypothetical protein